MSALFCGCDPEASYLCDRHRDQTKVRCTDCGWTGRGWELQAQACPICDGRVGEEGMIAAVSAITADNDRYILDGHTPVSEPDLLRWAHWFETHDRSVANDHIGEVRVSTVFLGLDHGYRHIFPDTDAELILFETMIFGGPHDGYQERYATWEQAAQGHQTALALVGAK